jgi:hypothetical protein
MISQTGRILDTEFSLLWNPPKFRELALTADLAYCQSKTYGGQASLVRRLTLSGGQVLAAEN